jgi:polyisoprenoid-binding protein YceI
MMTDATNGGSPVMSVTDTPALATTGLPAPGTYALDPSHTHVGFKVRHLMVSKVRGRFADFDGAVTVAEAPLDSSVEVTVQLASVDTRDAGRDEHLRGADFFDVATNPTMSYRSTGVREVGAGRFVVDGELTLAGTTRPLELQVDFEGTATDPWGNDRIAFAATGEVDREAYGLTWNQSLETGGVLVGKKVELEIEAQLVKQA